jgi:hypothetical protein
MRAAATEKVGSQFLSGGGGGSGRHTIVRPCSPLFADVLTNADFTGLYCRLCLSLFRVVCYNPAQLLGHMLGQREARLWREKSTG